jgi:hypothetical protein
MKIYQLWGYAPVFKCYLRDEQSGSSRSISLKKPLRDHSHEEQIVIVQSFLQDNYYSERFISKGWPKKVTIEIYRDEYKHLFALLNFEIFHEIKCIFKHKGEFHI